MRTKIRKWGINGEGIAYVNKKAVFVPGAIPDEIVDIDIDHDFGSYAQGHVEKIVQEAPRRRKSPCPISKECGGCALMHVDYKGQIRMKEQILKEALRRYAHYEGPIFPVIKNPDPLQYRNACKLPFGMKDGKVTTGMYARETNDFVPVERCLIHAKGLERARMELNTLIDQSGLPVADKEHPEGLKNLVLKEFDGKIHIVLVTGTMDIPERLVEQILEKSDHAASVWQSIKEPDDPEHELFGRQMLHLGGDMKMTLTLGDFTLNLLPKSFFQLNTKQALALYTLIESWLPDHTDLMVEAYCGIGAISLFAADKAKTIIGIESVEDAVANASENALLNGKENLSFVCQDAATELKRISQKRHVDTLVVDPPRSGLDRTMKDAILKAQPQNLIYVSCNPSTLGKDLDVLQKKYAIECVQPFDFFSQTPHVETAVKLSLKK